MDYSKTPNFRPAVQNSRKLPIRSAFVQLADYPDIGDDDGPGKIDLDLAGLNVRFNVVINPGNLYPRAQIDICNLSREHREYLTNYVYYQNPDLRHIRLFAGYLQEKEPRQKTPLIFSGDVLFTSFTPAPDIWTCMTLVHHNAKALAKQEWSLPGITFKQTVLEMAAVKMGLLFEPMDPVLGEVMNFSISGGGKKLLRDMQLLCPGYAVFIQDDTLTVYDKKRDEPGPGETVWVVREDTGLVGIPSAVLPKGIDCDLIMNPAILPGDWMKFESIHQPTASGYYRITRVRHHGELRGNDFLTSIETVRPARSPKE